MTYPRKITKMCHVVTHASPPTATVFHKALTFQGLRPSMEDFCECFSSDILVRDNGKTQPREVFVQCICDGHGGPNVARFVCSQVRAMFDTGLGGEDGNSSIVDSLRAMIVHIAARVKECVKDSTRSGTTLCMSVLDLAASKVYIVNCGDSRCAIYEQGSGRFLLQTKDHSASEESECNRIMDAGGLVFRLKGVPRVMGTLAITRAIGDFYLEPYVIPDPDIYEMTIESPVVIILASDGYWNVARGSSGDPKNILSGLGDAGSGDASLVLQELIRTRVFTDNAAISVSLVQFD